MIRIRLTVTCILLLAAMTLQPGCKKKNQVPDRAAVPSGPTTGFRDSVLTFTSSATDPDGDSVAIRFDWGDGDTSDWSSFKAGGASIASSHSWADSGTYTVRAQAEDVNGALSLWSDGSQIAIGTPVINNDPPDTPTTPTGDSTGDVSISYPFASSATDPDGDSVAIRFNWGDGVTSDWSSNVASGSVVTMSHAWSASGPYDVRAQAKDVNGEESVWSDGHRIVISGGGSGWTKTFGGARADEGYSVQQTSDGGYVIAGYTQSYGAGGADVYLIKTDLNGDTIWTRTFGGSRDDYGRSVQQTSDGGYVIAGYTNSYGAGGSDVYLIKTDASGDTMWTRTFGGSEWDIGYSLQQTSDGGYVIAGYTQSSGAGGSDVYLIKTDASGNQAWATIVGGSELDVGYSVQQTSDGGYVVAGYTDSYGAGSDDVYLIKTDLDGDTVWTRTFGGTVDDYGYSVRQSSDGGYVITGYQDFASADTDDVYLIKTDASGNQVWSQTFGSVNADAGYSVRQTSDGGYVIAGYTNAVDVSSDDVYLIQTDASGNQVWSRTFGGVSADAGYSVQQTSDGGYIIAGHTESYGAGSDDVYLIKTNASRNVK
jgi:hypothetical protein